MFLLACILAGSVPSSRPQRAWIPSITGTLASSPLTMDWGNPSSSLPAPPLPRLESMPVPLGEVAGGVVADGTTLVVVGEGSDATLSLDLVSGRWDSVDKRAKRKYPGKFPPPHFPPLAHFLAASLPCFVSHERYHGGYIL